MSASECGVLELIPNMVLLYSAHTEALIFANNKWEAYTGLAVSQTQVQEGRDGWEGEEEKREKKGRGEEKRFNFVAFFRTIVAFVYFVVHPINTININIQHHQQSNQSPSTSSNIHQPTRISFFEQCARVSRRIETASRAN
jgi:hypothetical protein